jgi:hypothetical protein
VELEQHRDQFRKLGLGVAAVSYDSVGILQDFAGRKGIHFPLLSDQDSKIIRALGILNESAAKDSPFYGIPHPGWFVLDAKGIIRAKYFEDDYRERYTSAGILLHQFGLIPAEAKSEVQGRQLTASVTVSNSTVSPGQRVALALDIELKPNMHVYAPGVEGYIPIDWTMKDSAGVVAHPAAYPTAEKLYLKAIQETVSAYRGRFRLTRDITIPQEDQLRPLLDASGHFTVEGSLRYQACDDRLCFIPQELPLKWTMQTTGLDRQRVPEKLQRKPPAP